MIMLKRDVETVIVCYKGQQMRGVKWLRHVKIMREEKL